VAHPQRADDAPRNDMMLTLTQAAKATGKSKSTLLRAIKTGRISAHKDESGMFMIDAAELHRVFSVGIDAPHDAVMTRHATADDAAMLRGEVTLLREQLDREREFNRQLSSLLGEEREERRKLTAMLTHQPEPMAHQPAPRLRKGLNKPAWVLLLALAVIFACVAMLWLWRTDTKPEYLNPAPPSTGGEKWKPDDGG
jgi:excisionase family DNA binding protein